jgi:hypothetical protein
MVFRTLGYVSSVTLTLRCRQDTFYWLNIFVLQFLHDMLQGYVISYRSISMSGEMGRIGPLFQIHFSDRVTDK